MIVGPLRAALSIFSAILPPIGGHDGPTLKASGFIKVGTAEWCVSLNQ